MIRDVSSAFYYVAINLILDDDEAGAAGVAVRSTTTWISAIVAAGAGVAARAVAKISHDWAGYNGQRKLVVPKYSC